jgi:hypothetical protein
VLVGEHVGAEVEQLRRGAESVPRESRDRGVSREGAERAPPGPASRRSQQIDGRSREGGGPEVGR